jgi:hypothetical protein
MLCRTPVLIGNWQSGTSRFVNASSAHDLIRHLNKTAPKNRGSGWYWPAKHGVASFSSGNLRRNNTALLASLFSGTWQHQD